MSDIYSLLDKISKTANSSPSGNISYIIAGLGNPDKKYANTRHNAGFMFMDLLSGKNNISIDRSKFQALTQDTAICGKRVLLMKPLTYMNNSGIAIRQAADFYKIPPENIIIIYDDISLDVGKMRIKRKGSAGGHNGIKSIIEHLGSESFLRIKLGVGAKPSPNYDLADWVLGDIPKAQRDDFKGCAENAYSALEMILDGKLDAAMNKYN